MWNVDLYLRWERWGDVGQKKITYKPTNMDALQKRKKLFEADYAAGTAAPLDWVVVLPVGLASVGVVCQLSGECLPTFIVRVGALVVVDVLWGCWYFWCAGPFL